MFKLLKVLLLDQQRSELEAFKENPDNEERSLLFLLQPPGAGTLNMTCIPVIGTESLIRVPLRNLLTGLTSHHILLQLLGAILLQGTKHVVPR